MAAAAASSGGGFSVGAKALAGFAAAGVAYLMHRMYKKTGGRDLIADQDAEVNRAFVPVSFDAKTTKVHILVAVPARTLEEALSEEDHHMIETNILGRDYSDAEYLQACKSMGVDATLQHVRLKDVPTLFDDWSAERRESTIIINFCDGIEIGDEMPGISVVRRLEALAMRYTGAGEQFFLTSTSKLAMKQLFNQHKVPTANYALVDIPLVCDAKTGIPLLESDGKTKIVDRAALSAIRGSIKSRLDAIGYPLIVKPDESYASVGIQDKGSVVADSEHAIEQCVFVAIHFGRVYCEQFISGREFTCLVLCDGKGELQSLPCIERVFDRSLSPIDRLITVGTYHDAACECVKPTFEISGTDPDWDAALRAVAVAAFRSVGGTGYGRVDLRLGWHTTQMELKDRNPSIFALEVNANCGIATNYDTVIGQMLWRSNVSAAAMFDMFLGYGDWRLRQTKSKSKSEASGVAIVSK